MKFRSPLQENALIRCGLILAALGYLALVLLLPLGAVFAEAFRQGVGPWLAAIGDPDAVSAIELTLAVATIAVP
jgi:sulfate transport system permease protein